MGPRATPGMGPFGQGGSVGSGIGAGCRLRRATVHSGPRLPPHMRGYHSRNPLRQTCSYDYKV